MSTNRINTSVDIDITKGRLSEKNLKEKSGNTTLSLESGDAGELLFAKLNYSLSEIFKQCHQHKSRFVGAMAPKISDWWQDCSDKDIFSFTGIKKPASDDDYSTVLSLENEDGEVSEVALASSQIIAEDEVDFNDEDGFYFMLARWGSCSSAPWKAEIEGEYNDAKVSLGVKRLSDKIPCYSSTDESISLKAHEFITSVHYDLGNKSESVTHELYDISNNPLQLDSTTQVLCIVQIRNHECSIVYAYDEERNEEQFMPLIENATLVNAEDDPLSPDTRHQVCTYVSLEDKYKTKSDLQEHNYAQEDSAAASASDDFAELMKR
ncbi:MAG TPA: hypothetical protein DCR21_03320 [Succinivibrionaceae bacterium]|nr:hypothetical protein [Succinivibrionaceae bacterium]